MSKMIRCCICGATIADEESNNPRPVKFEGRCCHDCDAHVMGVRANRSMLGLDPRDEVNHPYQWSEERMSSWMIRLIREKDFGKPVILQEVER